MRNDINIAELLRLYLEKDDFEVTIAGDGGKGVTEF
jgi:DNA-binding response OmpR family regulator